jgi:hypothetical protein
VCWRRLRLSETAINENTEAKVQKIQQILHLLQRGETGNIRQLWDRLCDWAKKTPRAIQGLEKILWVFGQESEEQPFGREKHKAEAAKETKKAIKLGKKASQSTTQPTTASATTPTEEVPATTPPKEASTPVEEEPLLLQRPVQQKMTQQLLQSLILPKIVLLKRNTLPQRKQLYFKTLNILIEETTPHKVPAVPTEPTTPPETSPTSESTKTTTVDPWDEEPNIKDEFTDDENNTRDKEIPDPSVCWTDDEDKTPPTKVPAQPARKLHPAR